MGKKSRMESKKCQNIKLKTIPNHLLINDEKNLALKLKLNMAVAMEMS